MSTHAGRESSLQIPAPLAYIQLEIIFSINTDLVKLESRCYNVDFVVLSCSSEWTYNNNNNSLYSHKINRLVYSACIHEEIISVLSFN